MLKPLAVEEQLQRILTTLRPLEPLELSVLEAVGCVLAEDVKAAAPLPAFDTVIQEGYAVQSVDLAEVTTDRPATFPVVDRVGAGFHTIHPVSPGTAVRVASGAMLPAGADAVVPIADTDGGIETVTVLAPIQSGYGIRFTGEFAVSGQPTVAAGTQLGPTQLAAVVAAGRSQVFAHPSPRVVIVSIGSELAEPTMRLVPGLIHDVDTVMLSAAITQAGGMAYRAGIIPDDPAVLATVIEGQLVRADTIILTGGVGGVVGTALRQLDVTDLAATRLEPGPIIGCGSIQNRIPLFSLPGNPVAAMVGFEVFVRPALRRLMGHRRLFRPVLRARLRSGLTSTAGMRRFALGAISGRDGNYVFDPVPVAQEISLLAAVSVNSFAVVPEETETLSAGDEVLVARLDRD